MRSKVHFFEKKVFTLPRNSGKIQISLVKRKKVVVRYKLANFFTSKYKKDKKYQLFCFLMIVV